MASAVFSRIKCSIRWTLFSPVAVGQLVGYLIKGDLLPLAGHIVFDIAGAYLIEVCLAQVMQQAADGVALGAFPLGEKKCCIIALYTLMLCMTRPHSQAPWNRVRGRRGEKSVVSSQLSRRSAPGRVIFLL